MKMLGREDATRTIRQLYQAYVDQHHRVPRMLIAIGGTAMAYHDMRKLSEDIDLYCPEDAFLPLAAELETATGLRIYVTSQTTLFGTLDIRDIEEDARVMENVEVEMDGKSFSVDIAAISPETLFVIKANTLREKDRDDLPAILEKTSPEQVFQRLEVLLSHAGSWGARRDLLLNVANEMQIVTLDLRPEWFQHPAMEPFLPDLQEEFPYLAIHQQPQQAGKHQQPSRNP